MVRIRSVLTAVGAVLALVMAAAPARSVPARPAVAATTFPVTGTKVATASPVSPTYWTLLEGAVTDGTYWYTAVLHNEYANAAKTVYYSSVELLKTPLDGSKPVLTVDYPVRSGNLSNIFGHANAMTYNPRTKQLLIPAINGDNTTKYANQDHTVQIVDAATLKVVGSKVLPNVTTALCYDNTNNRYVGRNGYKYFVYNSSFAQTSTFTVAADSMLGTSQSTDCDQSYIYVIHSPDSAKNQNQNYIYVWTYSGTLVASYTYSSAEEGENLTHAAGNYYAGFNTGSGQLYRLDNFSFTVNYAANGGTGSMAPTVVPFGAGAKLRPNTFTRAGYTFGGWTAHRAVDDKSLYASPDKATIGWYTIGAQPSGWTLSVYTNGTTVARTTPRGLVTFTAVWKAA